MKLHRYSKQDLDKLALETILFGIIWKNISSMQYSTTFSENPLLSKLLPKEERLST